MEIKKITKDEYQTVKVSKEHTEYIARDGRSFTDEKNCLDYEKRLDTIDAGAPQFTEIKTDDILLRMYFGAYGSITDEELVLWKATSDPIKREKAFEYLLARGFNKIYNNTLNKLEEGVVYAIASWTEDYHTDYPTYNGNIRKWDEILKEIDDFQKEMNNYKI